MKIFFTSDHHFGHANIIHFCNRPFSDVGEMDRAMIAAWNRVVGHDDVVYHLGDFTLTNSIYPWVGRLNFKELYIVPGGHDKRWMKRFASGARHGLVEILPPLVTLNLKPIVVLCHYPLLTWDRSHYGSVHLHGHSHGRIPDGHSGDIGLSKEKAGYRIDVGVDSWNFEPIAFEAILGRIK